jgi:hypothetical protein
LFSRYRNYPSRQNSVIYDQPEIIRKKDPASSVSRYDPPEIIPNHQEDLMGSSIKDEKRASSVPPSRIDFFLFFFPKGESLRTL